MTRKKGEDRLKREVLNRFQLCERGDAQKTHCVPEYVGEMYDEEFHEWLRR